MDKEKIKMKQLEDSNLQEIKEVVKFHNQLRNDNRTVEQWIWEYKKNYPDISVFTVLEENNEIVGSQAMIPVFLNIGGKRFLTGKSENSLLHPRYRGTTFFKDLYDFALALCKNKKMSCIWGFTSAVKVWQNKLGFHVYESLYDTISVINLPKTYSRITHSKEKPIKKLFDYFSSTVGYVYSVKRFFKGKKTGYSITNVLKLESDMDELYKKLQSKYPNLIHIHQDKKYINWRIYDNPILRYETYFVYINNALEGYCYACKRNNVIHLTDFTYNNKEVGIFLISYLLKKWKKDAGVVVFFGNIQNELIKNAFSLLKQFGFIKKKHTNAIVIKNITFEDGNRLYDVRNWYMNGLWTEGYYF